MSLDIRTKQDLLDLPPEWVLAHCVSEDCAMGAGIAAQLSKALRGMRPAARKHVDIMNARGERKDGVLDPFLYHDPRSGKSCWNLFTKQLYWHRSDHMMAPGQYLANLTASIARVEAAMRATPGAKLAMPWIGCGLDRCDRAHVFTVLYNAFAYSPVEAIICELGK